ncbi:DUF6284 family protein [Streptomyces sp. AcE210]|uniref:DUF6284 family protein n=1 Tax=Streptomyces sp. AcE210 TaxID=2292703 RepID=UPI000E306AF8|nr:DUF6284 family protein [Streptomyces sp. AcE210]RFC72309.1 hypothetical protein DXZ75_35785 [Streptomyces sp. AcE210]
MSNIVALQALVTADGFDREPTYAELNAIGREMPVILARVELLDAQIATLDRPATDLDQQRIRRARRKVLAARRKLANRSATLTETGGAA